MYRSQTAVPILGTDNIQRLGYKWTEKKIILDRTAP